MHLPDWKKVALTLSIAMMFNLAIDAGTQLVQPKPNYEEFCDFYSKPMAEEASCTEMGGSWYEEGGYCDTATLSYECNQDYQDAVSSKSLINFISFTAMGLLAIVFAFFIKMPSAVINGLFGGGIVAVLIGGIQALSTTGEYAQLIVTVLALLIMVAVGIKKMKD